MANTTDPLVRDIHDAARHLSTLLVGAADEQRGHIAAGHLRKAADMVATAVEVAELLIAAQAALADAHSDPAQAAADPSMRAGWERASGHARAALLLPPAWRARLAAPIEVEEYAGDRDAAAYAAALQKYAARHGAGDVMVFHGERFPQMPLPGSAGALATSLGFDEWDAEVCLETALILIALSTDQESA
ncbi:hypothetical protein [Nonomuraea salmonea]|uniref:Uncharacterized protein n=1 Tax=Nonomuraea salmonea TaxID=46181 RepID=A0ABV5P357_9ACTN